MRAIIALSALLALLVVATSASFNGFLDPNRPGSTAFTTDGKAYLERDGIAFGGPFTFQAFVRAGSVALNNDDGGVIFSAQRPFATALPLCANAGKRQCDPTPQLGTGAFAQLTVANRNQYTFELKFQDPETDTEFAATVSATAPFNAIGAGAPSTGQVSAVFRHTDSTQTQGEICLQFNAADVAACTNIGTSANTLTYAKWTQFFLARGVDETQPWFVGALDEVLFWNIGLYKDDFGYAIVNTNDERLTAYWQMDEGVAPKPNTGKFVAYDAANSNQNDLQVTYQDASIADFYPLCDPPASLAKRSAEMATQHEKRLSIWGLDQWYNWWLPYPLWDAPYCVQVCSWWGDPHFNFGDNQFRDWMILAMDGNAQWGILLRTIPYGCCASVGEQFAIFGVDTDGKPYWSTWHNSNGYIFRPQWGWWWNYYWGNYGWIYLPWFKISVSNEWLTYWPYLLAWANQESYSNVGRGAVYLCGGHYNTAWTGLCRGCPVVPGNNFFANPPDYCTSSWRRNGGCGTVERDFNCVCPQTCPVANPNPTQCRFLPCAETDGWACCKPVDSSYAQCGTLVALPNACTPPNPRCVYTGRQDWYIQGLGQTNCPSDCGTLVTRNPCPELIDTCTWSGQQLYPGSTCITDCGTQVDIDLSAKCDPKCKTPGTGWFDIPTYWPGTLCVRYCGIRRCPCADFSYAVDCPDIFLTNDDLVANKLPATIPAPGSAKCVWDTNSCYPEPAPLSQFYRFTNRFPTFASCNWGPAGECEAPCCTCGDALLPGQNCSNPPQNCFYNGRVTIKRCIADCGELVSRLTCVPPSPSCFFEGQVSQQGGSVGDGTCVTDCGTLKSVYGDCIPDFPSCKFVETRIATYVEPDAQAVYNQQTCNADCGRLVTVDECIPPTPTINGLVVEGCWYEDTQWDNGTQFGKPYTCKRDCGTLRCPCPDITACAPPPKCKYINVPYYASGNVFGRKAPAQGCQSSCGDLWCEPPVPPRNCSLCQDPKNDVLECWGQAYYDCSVALCDSTEFIKNVSLAGTCWYDRCVMGLSDAGVSTGVQEATQCRQNDACDPTCYDLDACPNMCSGPCNGQCNGTQCVCQPGYAGVDCSIEVDTTCLRYTVGNRPARPYGNVARQGQTVQQFINGDCDPSQSTLCGLYADMSAPSAFGSLTAYVFAQTSKNVRKNIQSFVLQTAMPSGYRVYFNRGVFGLAVRLLFAPVYRLAGTVTIGSNDNAMNTSLIQAVPLTQYVWRNKLFQLLFANSQSYVTYDAAASTPDTKVVFNFALSTWSGIEKNGFYLTNLDMSTSASPYITLTMPAGQRSGLDTAYIVSGDGDSECALFIDRVPIGDLQVGNNLVLTIASAPCNKECAQYTDCNSCQANAACGWCSEEHVCLAGDAQGPAEVESTAFCQQWRYRTTYDLRKRDIDVRQASTGVIPRVVNTDIARDAYVVKTGNVRLVLPAGGQIAFPVQLTMPCDINSGWVYDLHLLLDLNAPSKLLLSRLVLQTRAFVAGIRQVLNKQWQVYITLHAFSNTPSASNVFSLAKIGGQAEIDFTYNFYMPRTLMSDTGVVMLERVLRSLVLRNGGQDDSKSHLDAMVQVLNRISVKYAEKTWRAILMLTTTAYRTGPVTVDGQVMNYATAQQVRDMMLERRITPLIVVQNQPLTRWCFLGTNFCLGSRIAYNSLTTYWQTLVNDVWGFGYVSTTLSTEPWSDLVDRAVDLLEYARNSFQIVRDQSCSDIFANIQVAQVDELQAGTTVKEFITASRPEDAGKRALEDLFTRTCTMTVVQYGDFTVQLAWDDRPQPRTGEVPNALHSQMRDTRDISTQTIRFAHFQSPYADSSARIYVNAKPAHGDLYQYKDGTTLGAKITSYPAIITDYINQRVVYQSDWLYWGSDAVEYYAQDDCGYSSPSYTIPINVIFFNYPPTCEPCSITFIEDDVDTKLKLPTSNIDTEELFGLPQGQQYQILVNRSAPALFNDAGVVLNADTLTINPQQYTPGTFELYFQADDGNFDNAFADDKKDPKNSGACMCTVTILHRNHCPGAQRGAAAGGVTFNTGRTNNITIDVAVTDVDKGDPQRVFITAVPAFGQLFQCRVADFAVPVSGSLTTLCLPDEQNPIAVGDQVFILEELTRVVYVPAGDRAYSASELVFKFQADDFPVGSDDPTNALVQWCAGPEFTTRINVESRVYPDPPFPTLRRVNAWEDTRTTFIFSSNTVGAYDADIVKPMPAELGQCYQADGTPIDAAATAPVRVTAVDKSIYCDWTPQRHGDPNAVIPYLFGSIQFTLTDADWVIGGQAKLVVYPINHVPFADSAPLVILDETPDGQFQEQAFTPIRLFASDIDRDPTPNTLSFRITQLPALGRLFDSDGVTPLAVDDVLQTTCELNCTVTIYFQGTDFTYGNDSFAFRVEDGFKCGPVTDRPASPCQSNVAPFNCDVWADDGNGCTDPVTVQLMINHVNHYPFATLGTQHACENEEAFFCVTGFDYDVEDTLNVAYIQTLPAVGRLYRVDRRRGFDFREQISESMLPLALDVNSNMNGSSFVIGCVAYQPPANDFGVRLAEFAYTVTDGNEINYMSPPLNVPIDVYVVLQPPAVQVTATGSGDTTIAVQLAAIDQFTTNRTYATRIVSLPSAGTLLNADESAIIADGQGQLWLSDPYHVLFVPPFGESGQFVFEFEMEDTALIGLTADEFQTVAFGDDASLGVCTQFRPTTGVVTFTVDVSKVNHVPTVSRSNFLGAQNTLLKMDFSCPDIDGDNAVLVLQSLPTHGSLFLSMPANAPAFVTSEQLEQGGKRKRQSDLDVCGAVPDFGNGLDSTALNVPITANPGSALGESEFTLWFAPDRNEGGPSYSSLNVVCYDRNDDLATIGSYPTVPFNIDVLRFNQAPQISSGPTVISGLLEPFKISTNKDSNGDASKNLNLSVNDADLNGGELIVTVATDNGVLLFKEFSNTAVTFVDVSDCDANNAGVCTSVTFRGIQGEVNKLLAQTIWKNRGAGSAMINITVDDQGQSGDANPLCPSGVTVAYININAQGRTNIAAAAGGAAAGVGALGAVALSGVAAVAGWAALAAKGGLEPLGQNPFLDGLEGANGVTDSPAYEGATISGASPTYLPPSAVPGM